MIAQHIAAKVAAAKMAILIFVLQKRGLESVSVNDTNTTNSLKTRFPIAVPRTLMEN